MPIYAPDGSMNVTVVGGSSGGGGTTGGATSANQLTEIASLQSIDSKTVATKRPVKAEGGGSTSGTVSTATQVLAADSTRTKFEFQNLGTADIFLRINQGADTTVASTGTPTTKRMIKVPAGQLYVTESDVDCTGLISVASATASVPYTYFAS